MLLGRYFFFSLFICGISLGANVVADGYEYDFKEVDCFNKKTANLTIQTRSAEGAPKLRLTINNFKTVLRNAKDNKISVVIDEPSVGSARFRDRLGFEWGDLQLVDLHTHCPLEIEIKGKQLVVKGECASLGRVDQNRGPRAALNISSLECVNPFETK